MGVGSNNNIIGMRRPNTIAPNKAGVWLKVEQSVRSPKSESDDECR